MYTVKIGNMACPLDASYLNFMTNFHPQYFIVSLRNVQGPKDLMIALHLNSMNMSTILYIAEGGRCLHVHVFGMNLYEIY